MTKKHFVAMADFIIERRQASRQTTDSVMRMAIYEQAHGAYQLALSLAHTFGERFDRKRFDDYIAKHSEVTA